MGAFTAFFDLLLGIDSRLVTLNGTARLILEQHQSLEQRLLQKIAVQTVWLDNQDVMQKLKISESTLRRLRDQGTIPYSRIRGKYYYSEPDILAVLSSGANTI